MSSSVATGRALYPKEYEAWRNMRARCRNPKNPAYKNYGGRGITCCARWDSFWKFLADMGESPMLELTLERLDNNGSYEPDNCVWATRTEQAWNRRESSILSDSGVKGVCFNSRKNHYMAYAGRRQLYWGSSFEQAVDARKNWESTHLGVN